MSEKHLFQKRSPKKPKQKGRLENQRIKAKMGRTKKRRKLEIRKPAERREDSAEGTGTSRVEAKHKEARKISTTPTKGSETISGSGNHVNKKIMRLQPIRTLFLTWTTHKGTSSVAVPLALEYKIRQQASTHSPIHRDSSLAEKHFKSKSTKSVTLLRSPTNTGRAHPWEECQEINAD